MRFTKITRHVARLEREAQPSIERMRRQKSLENAGVRRLVNEAATLAFLIRHGDPQIEEPLWRAYKRCERSDAWKQCCERFPTALEAVQFRFEPWRLNAFAAELLRHGINWFFQGTDEKDKLSRVFKSAPAWFVWVSFADHIAVRLGLPLPNLSSVISRSYRFLTESLNAARGRTVS